MPNNFAPTSLTPQRSHPGSLSRDKASPHREMRIAQESPFYTGTPMSVISARASKFATLTNDLDIVKCQLKENGDEQVILGVQLQQAHEAERDSWKKRRAMIVAANNRASKIQNSSLSATTDSLYALYDNITGKKLSGFPRKVEDIEAMSDLSISEMLIALGELPPTASGALRRYFESTIGLCLPFRPPLESWVRPRRYPRKGSSSPGRKPRVPYRK